MDFVSTLLVTLNQPTGMWESILNAFKGATGTYILAVILIALIVRVLFSAVDIINKKVSMKNNDINAKMKPELEAIQKKYGNDQRLLQQKTNEIYKKYQFNMMGACLPMLIMLVLQFTVFLTLWNSLQAVSNFNIAEKYQDIKNLYVNVINLNEDDDPMKTSLKEFLIENRENDFVITADAYYNSEGLPKLQITIITDGGEIKNYEVDYVDNLSNEEIYNIISTYVQQPVEENPENPQVETAEYKDTGINDIIKALAESTVAKRYTETQEGFMWIKNIYKAESPTSPMFTEAEVKTYLSKYYTEDEAAAENENDYEGKIFKNVVAGIDTQSLGVNGYYILTIIAVAMSVLSLWLSNFLMRKKDQPKQKQSWLMYVIMPVIIGIFTFMYTSLFAIYLIVGQLVMIVLTPLTTLIVRKWNEKDLKKKQDKNIVEVDYRRKDG